MPDGTLKLWMRPGWFDCLWLVNVSSDLNVHCFSVLLSKQAGRPVTRASLPDVRNEGYSSHIAPNEDDGQTAKVFQQASPTPAAPECSLPDAKWVRRL